MQQNIEFERYIDFLVRMIGLNRGTFFQTPLCCQTHSV